IHVATPRSHHTGKRHTSPPICDARSQKTSNPHNISHPVHPEIRLTAAKFTPGSQKHPLAASPGGDQSSFGLTAFGHVFAPLARRAQVLPEGSRILLAGHRSPLGGLRLT